MGGLLNDELVRRIDVDEEINKLNDTFRKSSLAIEAIEQIQKKQEDIIYKITTMLTQINDARDHLKTNNFQSISSSSSSSASLLFEEKMFGILQLNEYRTHLSKSLIISEMQSFQLIKLCEFALTDQFTLLYRGSRDGFGAQDFHSKCNAHSPTLIIIKSRETSNIFGGFTSATWNPNSGSNLPFGQRKPITLSVDPYFGDCKPDRTAFIFSLVNSFNKPCKMRIRPEKIKYAITCLPDCGPIFGMGDIHIADRADFLFSSYAHLSNSYMHQAYEKNSIEARALLGGLPLFNLSEIEVYKKE